MKRSTYIEHDPQTHMLLVQDVMAKDYLTLNETFDLFSTYRVADRNQSLWLFDSLQFSIFDGRILELSGCRIIPDLPGVYLSDRAVFTQGNISCVRIELGGALTGWRGYFAPESRDYQHCVDLERSAIAKLNTQAAGLLHLYAELPGGSRVYQSAYVDLIRDRNRPVTRVYSFDVIAPNTCYDICLPRKRSTCGSARF